MNKQQRIERMAQFYMTRKGMDAQTALDHAEYDIECQDLDRELSRVRPPEAEQENRRILHMMFGF